MSFNVFDIAATGMHAQRIKMDTVSSNIANVNTTRNEFGEKQVYHKKQVNFKEMAIKKDFGFPKGNVDVSFDPPSEPYLVGGVSIGNDAISKGKKYYLLHSQVQFAAVSRYNPGTRI